MSPPRPIPGRSPTSAFRRWPGAEKNGTVTNSVSQALAACPLVIVSDVAAQTDTRTFAHIRFPA
ncbi:hypothetical protein G7B21_29160, partial [Klebsiella pneumoniae]|nr:hypothetical protein [Klebsiella pneumoniae]